MRIGCEIAENESENSASQASDERESDIVHVINLNKKLCREASIDQILNPNLINLIDSEYLFLILDPTTEAISKIRKAYGLHPILDYECSYSNSYSIDHMFSFDDCLFIALIDIPGSEDLMKPATLKILLMKKVMFIITSEKLDCIDEVLCNSMGFDLYKTEESDDIIRKSSLMLRSMRVSRRSALQTSYNNVILGELELVLYKILHAMFLRIEEIIIKMDEEVLNCIDFVTNLSINENNDFIIRMNNAQKNLSLCRTFVSKKVRLLPDLMKTNMLSKTFNEYLISMSLNMNKLEKRISSSKSVLKSYANVYNSYVDEGINQSSKKLNRLLQVFSATTSIFLPLNLIAAYMGMNVTVPFQVNYVDSLWPFGTIILFSVAYLIFVVILFKVKGWL